ncbi:MAG: hypothetical protein H6736_24615 [Alphaproteobacteria bacterium]|nr:hypothetical protein [Alphaproteobacteria bacterium]MCB9694999.1 hypothetical protein [Alphaproteobacteria bacterium]
MTRKYTATALATFAMLTMACMGFGQSHDDGFAVLCGAASLCDGCEMPGNTAFDDAVASLVKTAVTNEETLQLAGTLQGMSDDERAKLLSREAKRLGTTCALGDIYQARAKAFRAHQVARLCALGATCDTFDALDPASVVTCAEATLAPEFSGELARMNLTSPASLAQNLEQFARKHTTAGCALVTVLREAQ